MATRTIVETPKEVYSHETNADDRCLNCQNADQELLHTIYDTTSNGLYFFAVCKNCGYVFQTNRYEKQHYHDLSYDEPEKYLSHAITRAEYIKEFCADSLFGNRCFSIDVQTGEYRLKKKVEQPTILDIGCSRGGVLKSLKVFHYPDARFFGITLPHDKDKKKYFDPEDGLIIYSDIEKYFTEENKKKTIIRLFKNRVYDTYDWIIMSHVVEHLFDPLTTLLNIRGHLMTERSIIYIEVPSFMWGGVRTHPIFTPVHMSYFTVPTLVRLLDQSGLFPIKIHESKVWGNIKIVAKRSLDHECFRYGDYAYNWKSIKRKYQLAKIFGYPYYRLRNKYTTHGAND